jgi:stage II sporulation protein D
LPRRLCLASYRYALPVHCHRPPINRFPGACLAIGLTFLFFPSLMIAQTTPQAALTSALRNTPAVGVVLDLKTGRRIAVVRPAEAESLRGTPGSILKPLFLAAALRRHQVQPQSTIFCRRDLHINAGDRDWNLACTHPQTDVAFDAQDALAYSCNRYFTDLADRLSPEDAGAIMEHYSLSQAKTPGNREEKELLVLGVAGIAVSPAQIAIAYRKLALELNDIRVDAVREGLYNSVRYGMAHNAFVPGMEIAGKTGTASDTMQGSSHGWFAGIGTFDHEQVVAVVYLPRGNGADAARLAQHFFLATRPAGDLAPESARSLIVEVWASRSITHFTATSLGNPGEPVIVDWQNRRHLELSGNYRLQAEDAPEIVAAGKWSITWQPHGLRVLLTLPSESYVMAALSGEAAPDEPLASLKAMAISMRTFALVNANRHQTEGFGLCDSTHCQALRLGKPRPEVEQAVRETAGETLWSGGERAHVFYTQNCGGTSESASAVWPEEKAGYLAGHSDSYCLRRSPAQWQTRISMRQLGEIFHAQGWHTPSPLTDIRVAQRDAAGRAQLLQITGHGAPAQLSASSFRFAVDRALGWNQMRSDWYSLTFSGADIEIRGRGYGHGVGLCQAGAFEMAVEGRSDREILNFYFPGTVPGITPAGDGWQKRTGAGWTLLTTDPGEGLLTKGNAAWARAQSLLPWSSGSPAPTIQELPTTELFRQTTGEPGWMLASTRGSRVFLQPATVRRRNGAAGTLLLHEFLHVLVEQQAGANAPLWLREGLVEVLASPGKRRERVDLAAAEVDAALARPSSAAVSRQAHEAAAGMAALLCSRYGMPAMLGFLRNGVPSEAVKSPGS